MRYPEVPRGYSKSAMPEPLQQQLAEITQNFVTQVSGFMECREEFYKLIPQPGSAETVKINAGRIAGIKARTKAQVMTTFLHVFKNFPVLDYIF